MSMWSDYDAEADVMYIHFTDHPASNHSEMRDDGIILDYQDEQLVGLTVYTPHSEKPLTTCNSAQKD